MTDNTLELREDRPDAPDEAAAHTGRNGWAKIAKIADPARESRLLAAHFIPLLSQAMEAMGLRPITGHEIEAYPETAEQNRDDDMGLYVRMDRFNAYPKSQAGHIDHTGGKVLRKGHYPVRYVYNDEGALVETTTAPEAPIQTATSAATNILDIQRANHPSLPQSDYSRQLAALLNGDQLLFEHPTDPTALIGQHIAISLHANTTDDPLDLSLFNTMNDAGWNRVINHAISQHVADDYALLYTGRSSLQRLDNMQNTRRTFTRAKDSIAENRGFSPASASDSKDKSASRIEFQLAGAQADPFLAMLLVVSATYRALHAAREVLGNPPSLPATLTTEQADAIITQIDRQHSPSQTIPRSGDGIISRFEQHGMVVDTLKMLVEDLQTLKSPQHPDRPLMDDVTLLRPTASQHLTGAEKTQSLLADIDKLRHAVVDRAKQQDQTPAKITR